MELACAECGCRVEARVRVATCPDPACCCEHLATAPDARRGARTT